MTEEQTESKDLIEVSADTEEELPSWEDVGLGPECLSLVKNAGFTNPTLIQAKAIPPAIDGIDVLASARTGSGKTATFCLPVIDALIGRSGTFALILAPTREIALQTFEFLEEFAKPLGLNSSLVIGGINMKTTTAALQAYPHIIVGTPGRVADHLERGDLWLDYLEFVVLDEADRMLDMGFSKQLDKIIDATPKDRQTLLFSATMPKEAEDLAARILYDPVRIKIGNPKRTSRNVTQEIRWVNTQHKPRELIRIIEEEPGTIMVFTRTKEGASEIWRTIHSHGVHDSTYISSNKQQKHRVEALNGFKEGKYRVLIATDVAGRGIHVDNVALVVNYDFPMEVEDYIHRIGRTGRQDAEGKAITLAANRDRRGVKELEKRIGQEITQIEAKGFFEAGDRDSGRGGGRGGRGRPSRGGGGGRSGRSGDRGRRGGSGEKRASSSQGDGKSAAPSGEKASGEGQSKKKKSNRRRRRPGGKKKTGGESGAGTKKAPAGGTKKSSS